MIASVPLHLRRGFDRGLIVMRDKPVVVQVTGPVTQAAPAPVAANSEALMRAQEDAKAAGERSEFWWAIQDFINRNRAALGIEPQMVWWDARAKAIAASIGKLTRAGNQSLRASLQKIVDDARQRGVL